jgi:hypothetical protein
MGMTVSELAEQVRRPGEDLPALIAKLRNWTKEGLLAPEGDPHPGIGRSRVYPETAVADARALAVLADVIGIPAVKSKSFSDFFEFARKEFGQESIAHRCFGVSKSLDGTVAEVWTVKRERLDRELQLSKYPAHIVIDLKKYFEQLKSAGD